MTEVSGNLFNSNRKNIGVLLDNLSVGFTKLIWKELHQYSTQQNLNLILFPCDVNNHTELHLLKTVEFIQESFLDGLIVMTNTLTTFLDIKDVEKMCAKITTIPIVSIGVKLKYASCNITVEQQKGLIEAFHYLLKEMQCKRVAFIKGTENHAHTIERFEIYCKMMKEYDLEFDEKDIVSGNYFLESGVEAVSTLLNAGDRKWDAIVCSNDEMAIGVIKALEERNIHIPSDVLVVGFDNIPDVQYKGSMLATVEQPIKEMATQAISLMYEAIQGTQIPEDVILDSRFIWRSSAGFCNIHPQSGLFDIRETIDDHKFIEGDRSTLPEKLFVGLKDNRINQTLMVEGVHHFSSCQSEEELLNVVHNELPKVGINTCYLALYQKHQHLTAESNKVRFLWGYDHEKIYHHHFLTDFYAKDLLPVHCLSSERRYTLIIEPLFYGDHCFGYIVYALGIEIGSVYELVHRQICSALNVICLMEEQSDINQSLNSTLSNLKRTQTQLIQSEKMAALGTLVAGVAHEINTPIGVGVSAVSYLDIQISKFQEEMQQGKLTKGKFESYVNSFKESCNILTVNLNKAAHLITSFKNIAVDQTSEELRVFELKQYIEDVLVSLKPKLKKKKIAISLEGSEQILMNSYPGALSQILTNLVINAMVHGFEFVEEGNIYIKLIHTTKDVTIEFSDNGCGIESFNLAKIFDPFFTTKRGTGGSGLGLNIVFNLVTQTLQGQITCHSKINEGTQFIMQLPLNVKTSGGETHV